RSNNLFAYDIEKEKETQLTKDGSASIYNGWASWVYYEEILGRASQYAAFWWSPNSEQIAFLRFDDNPVPEFPIYRADGQHGELEKQRYPKAGDPNPFVKLGIANSENGKITWADFEEKADQYIAWPFWTKDSKQLTVQWMNRSQDNIIIYTIDPSTGNKKELYNEKQPQWVEFFEDLYFFDNGSGFILRSNVDGYSHLYYYDMNGKLKKRLTQGSYSVADIAYVDEKNGKVFFHSSMQKSWDKHLYVVKLDGSGLKQLTTNPGVHTCTVSPNGKYFYDRYSSSTKPPKLDLFKGDGIFIRTLADSKTAAMDEYDLAKVELFTISSGDGFDLPAVWFLPPDFDTNKKYPVLFSIYGGPETPSVRNSFPFFLEGYYLAQNGIIYISVDHRGSGHFGKKGVALMHRNLGKWEMNDYGIAAKWLKSKSFVDSTKIGISGGSYGGYIAALALTKGADYFTHGIAEFGVMDWKLYDNVYTERYMDTPAENPDGYKNSSVLNYVDKYKGKLLITHGTMDDNVHMQNTLQLVYELEKLDKDFELMLYPNARHGIGGSLRNHSTRESVQFWFKNFLERDLDINKD
ncbi:MAG: DPP IV N-terminal domain-containing protein, partial [Bacteroidota bacterium]